MKKRILSLMLALVTILTSISLPVYANTDLSLSEIETMVIDYFYENSDLDDDLVIFDSETIKMQDEYIFTVRWQGGTEANIYYAMVTVNKNTGEMFVEDEYVCNLWDNYNNQNNTYDPVLNGDFSGYAGVYKQNDGTTMELFSNGLRDCDISDEEIEYRVEDITKEDDGTYTWSVSCYLDGEYMDGIMCILYPKDVEVISYDGNILYPSDTSIERFWSGNGDVSDSQFIFYKQPDDENEEEYFDEDEYSDVEEYEESITFICPYCYEWSTTITEDIYYGDGISYDGNPNLSGTIKCSHCYHNFDIRLFDVSEWAKKEVGEAYLHNLIPYKMFISCDLRKTVSREEFAAIAVKLYEAIYGEISYADIDYTPFVDCDYSSTYSSFIATAYNIGITEGTSDTTFSPDENITREQLVTMLSRVICPPDNRSVSFFTDDYDISTYAMDAVYLMAMHGIIEGVGNNYFAPKETATREQAILIALRLYNGYMEW